MHQEKIIEIEETHVTFRNILHRRVKKPLENLVLITPNFRVPFRGTAYIHLIQADSVEVISTPMLKLIERSTIKAVSINKDLSQETGMFSTLSFIPITFALISLIGVLMWKNKEQLLNATVMNIIMFVIVLLMVSYF